MTTTEFDFTQDNTVYLEHRRWLLNAEVDAIDTELKERKKRAKKARKKLVELYTDYEAPDWGLWLLGDDEYGFSNRRYFCVSGDTVEEALASAQRSFSQPVTLDPEHAPFVVNPAHGTKRPVRVVDEGSAIYVLGVSQAVNARKHLPADVTRWASSHSSLIVRRNGRYEGRPFPEEFDDGSGYVPPKDAVPARVYINPVREGEDAA